MVASRRKTHRLAESGPASQEKPESVAPNGSSSGQIIIEREVRATRERIGDILRRAREARGDDLQQIADYLCIRPSFLIALENSHYEEFPADAYVIGFLRSYSEFLGLDGKQTIDYYRHEMAGRRKKPVLSMPTPIGEGRAPSAIILAGAVLAALFIYFIWYAFSTSDRASITVSPPLPAVTMPEATPHSEQIVPQPAFVDVTPTPSQPSPSAASHTPAAPDTSSMANALPPIPVSPSPPPTPVSTKSSTPENSPPTPSSHVTITANEASWVLVLDRRGRTVFDRIMKAGENFKVPGENGMSLTTGNGPGLLLTLDGSDLPRLTSSTGKIIRNIPLDPSSLRSYFSAGTE